ncbi:MAG: PDZ domain-containing protein, partial [Fimbriimonadaceae bacterium]|nr:PDZ domain-containing protein [Fimbriimonadaceae bacterium]
RLTTDVRPDTSPMWLDDDRILYVATGDESKRYLATVDRDGNVSEWLTESADISGAQLSPDRKWVAFIRGDHQLCVRSASGGPVRVITEGGMGSALLGATVFSWSPDSKWLAVSVDRIRGVEVRIHPVEGGEGSVVYVAGKSASTPVFSSDGQFVAFSAIEGNNYSEVRNSTAPLYAVRLVPEPVTFDEDALNEEETPPFKPDGVVRVVERGLRLRVRTLTNSSVGGIYPHPNGSSVWANVDGQFSVVNLATGGTSAVPGVTGFAGVADRTATKAYLIASGGRLLALDLRNNSVSPINASAEWRVDQAAEEKALFAEIWWAMSRFYYDPNMNGRGWDRIRAEFEPIVPHATSRQDFYALMGEMMERLDSSHLGATAPSSPSASSERSSTGWLGVNWDPAAVMRGQYVVQKVYEGTPAAHPDSTLLVGDTVTAIDGVALGAAKSAAELLDGSAGRKTMLTVRRGGRTMEIAIKPISRGAVSSVAYDDWVQWNKRYVEEKSNGRFGYIHIQGMNESSLDTFLREIQTDLDGKDGVLVDVRFNGGGYTSHIILNIMRKEPWLIRTNRDMPEFRFSENNYRGNALEMPAATLTNQYSFSNAEIFSEGFSYMKLGPVIGERTAGGVIGTGAYGLWDGGQIRMPGSGAYTFGMENLERNGRKPDFEVLYDPNQWQAGNDPQLDKAVQELLKRIR